jgi:formylglycine-generating enzyme required for sulfatase activity
MSFIPAGDYKPFLKSRTGAQPIPVAAFYLDRLAVTRRDFLDFVRERPGWRRSQVKRLFAEGSYLADWATDLDPGEHAGTAAQTFVSWFAAKAYCEYRGKRLPELVEWERVAAPAPSAPQPGADASREPFRFAMGRADERLGEGRPVFGSVWEWTSDFNGSLVSGKANPGDDPISTLFCGAGARAVDASDYGAFLRYSFRSSLKASYTLKNLGFRCARDAG